MLSPTPLFKKVFFNLVADVTEPKAHIVFDFILKLNNALICTFTFWSLPTLTFNFYIIIKPYIYFAFSLNIIPLGAMME